MDCFGTYLDKSGSQRATIKVADPLATVKVGGQIATVRLAGQLLCRNFLFQ